MGEWSAGALLAEPNEPFLIENMETYSSSLQCLQNIVKQETGRAGKTVKEQLDAAFRKNVSYICVYGPI